jgi:CBS domain-containing protein
MSGTTLGTLITYNPWAVGPAALLDEIAARFADLGVHHVPVIDTERRVIGMLSETDLLRARQSQRPVLAGAPLSDTDDAPLIFARDVMSREVVTISPSGDLHEALGLLLQQQIHALPVVDSDRLIGMVSSRDFLREFSYGEIDCANEPVSRLIKSQPPEPLAPDATLDEALLAMQDSGISSLAVAQGNCPLGIVSQRDIVREKCRAEEQAEYHQEMRLAPTVLRVLQNSPAIRTGQRLCEAAAAMIDHGLPAVTVVNQSSKLLGLITEDDLLQVMYDAQA